MSAVCVTFDGGGALSIVRPLPLEAMTTLAEHPLDLGEGRPGR
jgi:hypothetical protein